MTVVDRVLAVGWLLLSAGCDCGYRRLLPDGGELVDTDGGSASDAAGDAAIPPRPPEEGEGQWILEQGGLELYAPACAFEEGQRVFVRLQVIAPSRCQEPGPVDVRVDPETHEVLVVGHFWESTLERICSTFIRTEDRWVELGPLEQGTWTVVPPYGAQVTIDVGPPSGRPCADPRAAFGEPCQTDCDCVEGSCMPDLADGSCDRRCGDLPCGVLPDCLQGRCPSEMPQYGECLPTDGPCTEDADCPPAQRCEGDSCVFRLVAPFTACTSGRDCAAGWSCVQYHGLGNPERAVCAVRCFTERTPCPIGTCLASPSFGPAWTCAIPGG